MELALNTCREILSKVSLAPDTDCGGAKQCSRTVCNILTVTIIVPSSPIKGDSSVKLYTISKLYKTAQT